MSEQPSTEQAAAAPTESAPGRAPTPRRQRLAFFSPTGMWARAAIVAGAFFLCHLLGLRQDVSGFFATASDSRLSMIAGGLYIIFYLGTVFLCPTLLLAGLFMAALSRMGRAGRP